MLEPRALDELLPTWREDPDHPLQTPVTKDKMVFLTKSMAIPIPHPPTMHNNGNFIVSLSAVVRWLGKKAEDLGVEIYAGIAASEVLYSKDADGKDSVIGIATNDVGLDKNYQPKVSKLMIDNLQNH